MWTASRPASVQSLARSIDLSRRTSNYDEMSPRSYLSQKDVMWQPAPPPKVSPTVHIAQMQATRRGSISEQSTATEDSHATLAEEQYIEEMNLKTPTVLRKEIVEVHELHSEDDEEEVEDETTPLSKLPAGPLEATLLSLLSKVTILEREQPTVMATDYHKLEARVAELEAEKAHWMWRFEEMLTARDGDVFNLIKVRDELAASHRSFAEMCALRDEDLEHVQELRNQLAKQTWAKAAGVEPGPTKQFVEQHKDSDRRLSRASSATRDTSAVRASRGPDSNLWQAAKTAALEQRVLELEKANDDLRVQAEAAGTSEGGVHIGQMEAIFDTHALYRERMGMRVQQLRSEKEALMKEAAMLEDKNAELEAKMEKLQRHHVA